MKKITLFVTIAIALVAAGAAGAIGASHVLAVKKGDRADFRMNPRWSCFNAGTVVRCQSGDTAPWAELTSGARGITVRVHTLKDPQGGSVSRRVSGANAIYTFTAFGG